MGAEIRWFWARLNANYWFYPALFSVFGGILALTLIHLDRAGFAGLLDRVPQIVPARPASASNMLTVIAGSMIGTAATVFSITIAAVAYASGTYGPRLLTNFMEDKGNQFSLATFIGTFVYAITVLRTIRNEDEAAPSAADAAATALPGFVPQLSLLVAYLLMAIAVGVLVYFLNHIPASIRINTVLEGIGRRLIEQVREEFPRPDCGSEPSPAPRGVSVPVRHTGYVQLIDFADLAKFARKHGCEIALKVRTGDFVHPGMALAELAGCSAAGDDRLAEELADCFILGATRTPKQDPDFLIDELVEIALRALSPGINDPFTAITALHWLGAATAELARRDLRKQARDEAGEHGIHPLPDGFAHYVKRGFGGARSAVATSRSASIVALEAMQNASLEAGASRQGMLRDEGERLMAQARLALAGPDLADLERRYAAFMQAFPPAQ